MQSYANMTHAELNEIPQLRDGDVLSIGYKRYKVGSVASYALQYNECPIEAVKRAEKDGHELHYVYGLGTAITAQGIKPDYGVAVEYGDVIYFEGHLFELIQAPNYNVELKMLPDVEFMPVK